MMTSPRFPDAIKTIVAKSHREWTREEQLDVTAYLHSVPERDMDEIHVRLLFSVSEAEDRLLGYPNPFKDD